MLRSYNSESANRTRIDRGDLISFGTMKIGLPILVITAALVSPVYADDGAGELPDIWQRPTLLGGPGSAKEALSEAGIDLDAWVTQTYQGVISGDGTHDWQYGGKATVTGNIDAAKLGLWSGLSFNLIFEQNFGEDANSQGDGTLLPINGITAFPRLGGYDHDIAFTVTQRINDAFSVSVGKFNLLHLVARTPLVGGGGEETFLNAAFAGPITGVIPPYLFGAIANIHTDAADYTIMVYDPRNAQDWDVVTHPFEEGVSVVLSATVPTRIYGLPGYYGVRGVYSTAEGLDLSRIPEFVELPPQSQASLDKKGYWYLNASVQQYLYEDPSRPGKGWGVFGYAAIADGNPNVLKWTVFAGLAGDNPLPARNMDKWGIGYFRYGLSDDLIDGLSTLGIDIQDEEGVEAFYNLAVTPWMRLTADIQWINPFQSGNEDAVIGTFRARTLF